MAKPSCIFDSAQAQTQAQLTNAMDDPEFAGKIVNNLCGSISDDNIMILRNLFMPL